MAAGFVLIRRVGLAAAVVLAGASAWAGAMDEARALRNEGLAILKAAREPGGDLHSGSKAALSKFEAAVAKVEGARENTPEAELETDLNSLIFWTRRTMPLDLFGGSGGGGSRPAAAPAKPAAKPPAKPAAPTTAEAEAALARAESYAKAHPKEEVTVAARFFAIADRYKDVHDVAFKAISRAQHYQRLAKGRRDAAKATSSGGELSAGGKLVAEGDRAYASARFDQAAAKYSQAIAARADSERYRKLGHAHFERAQQYRDQYAKAYRRELDAYKRAKQRKDRRGMARAASRAKAAGNIAQKGIEQYEKACGAFESAWKMSERLDIDSEVHMALTYVIRKEAYYRNKARGIFERVLRTYAGKLATDEERTLYAHAETYAGPAVAERIREELARKARASAAARKTSEAVSQAAGDLEKVPDRELIALIAELKYAVMTGEAKLKQKQALGMLDKSLYDSILEQKKQLGTLTAEAERRGLKP